MRASFVGRGVLARVAAYGRLVRFPHTVFAMPFAMLAVFLAARGWCGWGKFGLILACMVAARSAAMAFNRIADVRIDARNPRTAGRPLQTGQLTLTQAWAFYAMCGGAFLLACAGFWWLYDNPWPIRLGVPVLAFISVYSLAKRFTWLCHVLLGASLGISPMAAWLAVEPATWGLPAMTLGLAVLCWSGGFDIIYALQDLQVDRREGLKSLPARFGPSGALWISRSMHLLTVGLLLWLALLANLGWVYLAGLAITAGLLVVEQSLVSPRDFSRAGAAFLYANSAVSLLLAGAGIADVFLHAR